MTEIGKGTYMSSNSVVKKIKKANFTWRIVVSLVLIGATLLIAFLLIPQHTKYYTARENIFSLPCNTYKVDKYYKGKTYSIYDWFAENKDGKFYIAPVQDKNEEDYYLIVYIPKKYEAKAETIMDQTYEYMDSGDDSVLTEYISCNGYVTDVNAKTSQFLDQYFDAISAPQAVRERVCSKMFVMVPLSKVLASEGTAYIALCLIMLVCALITPLTGLTGSYLKPLKKKLSAENMTLEDLDNEFSNTLFTYGNIQVSKDHIIQINATPTIFPIKDIVWIYPSKMNQVNSAPICRGIFMTRYHQCFQLNVKNQAEADSLCQNVHKLQSRALYGYVIENSTMYYKHFNELIDHVYNQSDAPSEGSEATGNAPVSENTSAESSTPVFANQVASVASPSAASQSEATSPVAPASPFVPVSHSIPAQNQEGSSASPFAPGNSENVLPDTISESFTSGLPDPTKKE